MKCPHCKIENPEGMKYCGSCGKEIVITPPPPVQPPAAPAQPEPQYQPYPERTPYQAPPPMPRIKSEGNGSGRLIAMVVTAIVIVIIIVAALYVFLSPSISPFEAIRDSDGDGISDTEDAAPNDPTHWAWGEATLLVTVQSNHLLFSIDYELFIDDTLEKTGTLSAGSSITYSFDCDFLIGTSSTDQVVVSAFSSGGGFGDESDQKTVILQNGGTSTVTLTI